MPKLSECGWGRRLSVAAICCMLLALLGCSNGRGSVGQSGQGQEPPPTQPATPSTFRISGAVSGLAGSGLVLQLNGANDARIDRDGTFSFTTQLADAASYAVTVSTQPSNPAQTCTVSNGTGVVSGQGVTNVTVVCSTQSFSVGGTVAGLEGRGLVLKMNGSDDLAIASNGAFTFATPLASGATYEITVSVQPQSPSQSCTVANATGVVGSGTARAATVTCATNTFAIGGTVVGLEGDRLVLQNSGAMVEVQSDGTFTFPNKVASGGTYDITVQTHPANPAQACSVANGTGTVGAADITNVSVTCTRAKFTIGGTISGLAGTGLLLRNNGTDDLTINGDGAFTFATAIESGRTYDVSVARDPVSPAQRCTVVANATGTVGAENVTNVQIQCVTIEFTIGGNVSGLRGAGLVLRNNGVDDLPIAADGAFTFAASVPTGTPYAVTVAAQPSNPTQVCAVTNGSGPVDNANITTVSVTCETSRFTVSVTVTGLRGFSLRVRNNEADDLLIHSNGTHTFPTPILSGEPFNVTIVSGPIFPFQTCTASNASGTVTSGNVDVPVTCN